MKRKKPYWEMNLEELREATKEFDDPHFHPKALPWTKADREQERRARNKKPGRPRVGAGAAKVRVSMEKRLLRQTDAFAKKHDLSRSELVARGLRAVLAGAA